MVTGCSRLWFGIDRCIWFECILYNDCVVFWNMFCYEYCYDTDIMDVVMLPTVWIMINCDCSTWDRDDA